MRTPVRRFAVGAALVVALNLLAGPGAAGGKAGLFKPLLPPAVYQPLVERAVKNIEPALADTSNEQAIHKARFNATIIAAYTLSTRDGSATLREEALKLAKLLAKKGKA